MRTTPLLASVLAGVVLPGKAIPDAADAEARAKLSKALTLHASFDRGLDADFSRGDRKCYVQKGQIRHGRRAAGRGSAEQFRT